MVGSIITRIGLLHYWSRFVTRVERTTNRADVPSSASVHTATTRLSPPHFATMNLEQRVEISGLSKTEAEDLLDWLEATGNPSWELAGIEHSGFVLRRK